MKERGRILRANLEFKAGLVALVGSIVAEVINFSDKNPVAIVLAIAGLGLMAGGFARYDRATGRGNDETVPQLVKEEVQNVLQDEFAMFDKEIGFTRVSIFSSKMRPF